MKRDSLILLVLLSVVTAFVVGRLEGATRIGLVTKDESLADLADLITVRFSQTQDVVLLERAQLQRIWQEQTLQAGQRGEYRNLGKVLGADGILLMERYKEGTNSFLATRLLAVHSGAVADFSRHKLPLPDPSGWADLFVRRQTDMLPKLHVSREEAVPLSFLNVRASLVQPGSAVMEQQLNVLINHRLMSQPEFFLLERRQLSTLVAEKELQEVEDAAFWTGSHILEGVIDKNGIVPGKTTLSLTLQSPGNRQKTQIEVTGESTDLPSLVEQALAKLLLLLKGKVGAEVWSLADEASQYADEAAWAAKWNLTEEAQIAADTSWMLGQKTLPVAKMRISSRQPGARTKLEFRHLNNLSWPTNAPIEGKLSKALNLLLTYDECSRQLNTDVSRLNNGWPELGLSSLETAAQLLEHYRLMPREQGGKEKAFSELKSECRHAVHSLQQMLPQGDRRQAQLDLLKLRYCSHWAENPTEAVNVYRALFQADTFVTNRPVVLLDKEYKLRYWQIETQPEVRKLWNAFVNELKHSSNLVQRCDGQLLHLRDLLKTAKPTYWDKKDTAAFHEAVTSMLQIVWDDTRGFDDAVLPTQLTAMETLIRRRAEKLTEPWAKDMLAQQKARAYQKFKHYLRHLPDLSPGKTYYGPLEFEWTPERIREVIPLLDGKNEDSASVSMLLWRANYSLMERADYLRKAKVYDREAFSILFGNNRDYSGEEATLLRPLLVDFKTRLPAAGREVDSVISRKMPSLTAMQEQVKQQGANDTARAAELANLLANGRNYDRRTAQALSVEYFSPEDARKLLGLWKAHLQQTGAERPLAEVETHLQARSFPLEDVKNYFLKTDTADEKMLVLHITARRPTRVEAEQIKPVFMEHAKRTGMPEGMMTNYRRQLDAAIEAESK